MEKLAIFFDDDVDVDDTGGVCGDDDGTNHCCCCCYHYCLVRCCRRHFLYTYANGFDIAVAVVAAASVAGIAFDCLDRTP